MKRSAIKEGAPGMRSAPSALLSLSLTTCRGSQMPLYTYVVSFKGACYVAQGSHSNHKGFVSTWCSNIPAGALPGLTAALHKELVSKAYSD